MKKIDFGQTIGLLANAGVIAGIVFLAIELRQNNELLEAEIRTIRHDFRSADYLLPLQHRDFANALIKRRRGEDLTEYETLIMNRSMAATLYNYEYVFTEYSLGRITSLPVAVWQSDLDGEIGSDPGYFPDLREYWEATKNSDYDPEFVEWMEQNILNH